MAGRGKKGLRWIELLEMLFLSPGSSTQWMGRNPHNLYLSPRATSSCFWVSLQFAVGPQSALLQGCSCLSALNSHLLCRLRAKFVLLPSVKGSGLGRFSFLGERFWVISLSLGVCSGAKQEVAPGKQTPRGNPSWKVQPKGWGPLHKSDLLLAWILRAGICAFLPLCKSRI